MATIRTSTLFMLAATAGLSAAMTAPTLGQAVFQPHSPDFYQHQRSNQALNDGLMGIPNAPDAPPAGNPTPARYNPAANINWWENGGGWCATTAWTNALYQQQRLHPNEAFRLWDRSQAPRNMMDPPVAAGDAGHSWIQRMSYANEDVAIFAAGGVGGGCITPFGMQLYLDSRMFTYQMVCYSYDPARPAGQRVRIQQPDGSTVADPNHATLLDLYRETMRTDTSLVMEISPGTNQQWWGNFHVLSGAGASLTDNSIWFADPNDTFRGANWGRRYRDAGEMTPNMDEPAVPVGGDIFPDQLRDYTRATLDVDGRTFTNGPYVGSRITNIWTLRVPTPSSGVIACLFGIGAIRRRRNQNLARNS